MTNWGLSMNRAVDEVRGTVGCFMFMIGYPLFGGAVAFGLIFGLPWLFGARPDDLPGVFLIVLVLAGASQEGLLSSSHP